MKVNCDVVLTVMASSLYRLLGAKVAQGYEIAKSKHILRDLINATGQVAIAEKDVTVRLQKRAHNPFLIAAGSQNTDFIVPWLGRKRLHVISG